jgi:23S rRNA (uracil1939-C5)-methyltransferase
MGCLPKAISALRDRPPKYLIYVSCNPATLARDLKLLCADGLYKPEKCALFDMFPRTAHFESVVFLIKENSFF